MMKLCVFYTLLSPDHLPTYKEFEGIRDFVYIKGSISFNYFDKYISGFRTVKLRADEFLYYTLDVM